MMRSQLILVALWLFSAHCGGMINQSLTIKRCQESLDVPPIHHEDTNLHDGLKPSSYENHRINDSKKLLNPKSEEHTGPNLQDFKFNPRKRPTPSTPVYEVNVYGARPAGIKTTKGKRPSLFDNDDYDFHKRYERSQLLSPETKSAIALQRLIDELGKEKPLTPELVSKLEENWGENFEEVIQLYKNWDLLSSIESKTNGEFYLISVTRETKKDAKTWEARKVVEDTQSKLEILVQLRSLKLGEADSTGLYWKLIKKLLPALHEQPTALSDNKHFRLEAEKQLQNLGASILNEVKKLMTDELRTELEQHALPSRMLVLPWKYAFTVVDLLHENGFLDEKELQSLLREEEIAKQVIFYSNELFAHESFPADLPGQTPWEHLNESFKALDAETRNRIENIFSQKLALGAKARNRKERSSAEKPKGFQPEDAAPLDDVDKLGIRIFVERRIAREQVLWRPHEISQILFSPYLEEPLYERVILGIEKGLKENKWQSPFRQSVGVLTLHPSDYEKSLRSAEEAIQTATKALRYDIQNRVGSVFDTEFWAIEQRIEHRLNERPLKKI
ncbi:hypothetical protein PGT21_014872 [Puccinia graminis f. sp. tritici]|uniref:Uncharacterized protein n=1 Tax=Puccinia graminis f. sp. tritici TaxID=56615 RepID=A0A5B0LRS1_PUCGR|nr:hypothetical protein PGT21_014872 [Puccinia graminis f. sp. tritici]KAA1093559.1 hypothetical protein PGTUg99_027315 [Puccinia graminis f. sp. tritici]